MSITFEYTDIGYYPTNRYDPSSLTRSWGDRLQSYAGFGVLAHFARVIRDRNLQSYEICFPRLLGANNIQDTSSLKVL